MSKYILPGFVSFKAIAGGTDAISPVTNIEYKDTVGIMIIGSTDNALTGTLTMQVSLDYIPGNPGSTQPINAGTWATHQNEAAVASTWVLSSPTVPAYYERRQVASHYIRFAYTGGGTGTLTVLVCAKQI